MNNQEKIEQILVSAAGCESYSGMARGRCLEGAHNPILELVSEWANSDLSSAVELLNRLPEGHVRAKAEGFKVLARTWASRDPAKALEFAVRILDPTDRALTRASLAVRFRQTNPGLAEATFVELLAEHESASDAYIRISSLLAQAKQLAECSREWTLVTIKHAIREVNQVHDLERRAEWLAECAVVKSNGLEGASPSGLAGKAAGI